MMKLVVDKARVHVSMRNRQQGSVLQGTVKTTCLGIETRLELESNEPPDRVAALVRNAENGCFTMQALMNPSPVTTTVTHNGAPLPTMTPGE